MRSLPEIKAMFKAMNAAVVDRNVTVHLRARQADIYEKALRKIMREIGRQKADDAGKVYDLARLALVRAEKLT